MIKSFEDIVGQSKLKKRLEFYIEAFTGGGVIPNLAFIAPKGCGKTKAAETLGIELFNLSKGVKNCHVINCSTIKNVSGFVNQILIPHVVDKQCTLILDEASELPKDVTMFMLSMLNPNQHQANHVVYDDYNIDIIFRDHTFVLSTSESHRVFPPLLDRCTRVELEEYTCDDIAKIILKQGVKITDDALPKVSSVCRGNARSAVEISQEIARYQHAHPGVLTSKGWNLLCGIIGYLPLGLSNIELTLLKVLKDRPDGTSLTRIGACLGMTREAVQKDLELFPAKLGLIEITTGGRVLTPKGQQYLKELGV